MRAMGCNFRVKYRTWWKEVLSSEEEYATAHAVLERIDWVADYIITHCAPTSIVKRVNRDYEPDKLTDFFEEVKKKGNFHYWLFGHYHENKIIDDRYVLLWEQIV